MRRNDPGRRRVGRTGARFPPTALLDEPPSPAGPEAAGQAAAALPSRRVARSAVGVTGARFGRRGSTEPLAEPEESGEPTPATGPDRALPAPRTSVEEAPPIGASLAEEDDQATAARGVPAVRPYVLTRGRTRCTVDLPVEALITADPADRRTDSALVELCRVPRSVAEVAAHGGVPLGVARVLIGDFVATGRLVVHGAPDARGPSVALLERVLTGLRNL